MRAETPRLIIKPSIFIRGPCPPLYFLHILLRPPILLHMYSAVTFRVTHIADNDSHICLAIPIIDDDGSTSTCITESLFLG